MTTLSRRSPHQRQAAARVATEIDHPFALQGAGAVRFVDTEEFNGLLVPLQAGDIDTNSRRWFEEMDKALKARAEQS